MISAKLSRNPPLKYPAPLIIWVITIGNKNNLTIHNCLLSELDKKKKYDVVTVIDVIEHVNEHIV